MIHFFKYLIIGVGNTLLTLFVFWIADQFQVEVHLSNVLGFTAGGINSYLWNKKWNFKSSQNHTKEAPRFVFAFLLGYALNLGVLEFFILFPALPLWIQQLFSSWPKLGITQTFVSNTLANVVYVLASFTLIRWFVFKEK